MYTLKILTPEAVVLEEESVSIIAPGDVGYLEILTNHAPIITTLVAGNVIVTHKNKEKSLYRITGGFLEVHANKVHLLADEIEIVAEKYTERRGVI